MTKLILILLAAVIAMSGAIAKPGTEILTAPKVSIAPLTKAESTQLLNGLAPVDEITPRLKKIKASIQALRSPLATKKLQMASLKRGYAETVALDQTLVKLRKGFDAVEQRTGSKGGKASVDAKRAALRALMEAIKKAQKEVEESIQRSSDFDTQELMSKYDQAEQLASNVKKKANDAHDSIIQNIAG